MRRSDGWETGGIKRERGEQQEAEEERREEGWRRRGGGEKEEGRRGGEAKAALFKQIRFGEIGLSLQDGDDLHPSIRKGVGVGAGPGLRGVMMTSTWGDGTRLS